MGLMGLMRMVCGLFCLPTDEQKNKRAAERSMQKDDVPKLLTLVKYETSKREINMWHSFNRRLVELAFFYNRYDFINALKDIGWTFTKKDVYYCVTYNLTDLETYTHLFEMRFNFELDSYNLRRAIDTGARISAMKKYYAKKGIVLPIFTDDYKSSGSHLNNLIEDEKVNDEVSFHDDYLFYHRKLTDLFADNWEIRTE